MSGRIGVYGGTFDPIHVGHLATAEAVRQEFNLDSVIFVPNWHQPLKPQAPSASATIRWAMLEKAIAGNAHFVASDIELRQRRPAFSINTMDALRRRHVSADLRFVMGVDAANQLGSWREPERILTDYRPILVPRAGFPGLDWEALERIRPDARELLHMADAPALELSSSGLRAMVAMGRSIRYLVPDTVLELILRERLYVLDE